MPSTAAAPVSFPGHVIALDSRDTTEVLAIQHRLNTNESGSPEGTGVFRRTGRKIVSINKGFIDYNSL